MIKSPGPALPASEASGSPAVSGGRPDGIETAAMDTGHRTNITGIRRSWPPEGDVSHRRVGGGGAKVMA